MRTVFGPVAAFIGRRFRSRLGVTWPGAKMMGCQSGTRSIVFAPR